MDLAKYWTLEKLAASVRGRLVRGDPGLAVRRIVVDSRKIEKGDFFWALEGARTHGNDHVAEAAKKGAAGAFATRPDIPGLPASFALVTAPHGVNALGRLAAEHRALFKRLVTVGVTGSNGKTTTKELLSRVLAQGGEVISSPGNFNNEIGCPLSVLEITDRHRYGVFELAARKKGDIGYLSDIVRPTMAILTSISPAHLETFGREETIFETKAEILRGMIRGAPVIYWAEDPWLAKMPAKWPGFAYTSFGLESSADVYAQVQEQSALGMTARITYRGKSQGEVRLPLLAMGPVRSALAAVTAGLALGLSSKKIFAAIENFEPAPMRGQKIFFGKDVFQDQYTAINDAYNANPASMLDGSLGFLRAYRTGRRIVVLGEMRELGAKEAELHEKTGAAIADEVSRDPGAGLGTAFVVIGGRLAQAMAAGLKKCEKKDGPQVLITDREKALEVIKRLVFAGKPPCYLYFKASRAEALETLIQELGREF